MAAYYNEFDPFAAEWLRALIAAGHIAPGDVDTRSIVDVRPDDLKGYTQCHFFAGIGVWSYALRRAGWPDSRPIWTGSCPCQPFSAAGKGGGFDDERHLWPHFHYLIEQCGPPVVAGEQVASKDGLAWLDLVQADMEGTGYAFGAVDTCSAGFGAPHIRQRLYWIGEGLEHATGNGRFEWRSEPSGWGASSRRSAGGLDIPASGGREWIRHQPEHGEPLPAKQEFGGMADAHDHQSRAGRDSGSAQGEGLWPEPGGRGDAVGVADAELQQRSGSPSGSDVPGGWQQEPTAAARFRGDIGWTGPTNGLWRDADWLFCRDGKWRPVEPGTFPLAHGAPARVGRLRGYGNAINAEAAQAFIEAYIETEADRHLRLNDVSVLTNDKDVFS